MLRVIHAAHEAMEGAVGRGVAVDALAETPALREIARMRSWPDADATGLADNLTERVRAELRES